MRRRTAVVYIGRGRIKRRTFVTCLCAMALFCVMLILGLDILISAAVSAGVSFVTATVICLR